MWVEKITARLTEAQVICDSKTPSGTVHVGSLRGVLIHDSILRALHMRGVPAKFFFGVDDLDPLDDLAENSTPELRNYMGVPLARVPPPPGSDKKSFAEHYIAEFLDIFPRLGVRAEIYRMSDLYSNGALNESIDLILSRAHEIRKIFSEVSGTKRGKQWHPFQVVCENCARIATTEVTAYENGEVEYHCRKDWVSWASGCGYSGKCSPFDGAGKLPWKLEWTAKWHHLGTTIEGAGKDHCTKGGARDIANACYRTIFDKQPPLNVPYEFFLWGGEKMSSSKGVGVSAGRMASFLPPDLLRYLMIRTHAKKTVNFSTEFDYIVKLFNEYDALLLKVQHDKTTQSDKLLAHLIQSDPPRNTFCTTDFQLLVALKQLPHVDPIREVEKRNEAPLTETQRAELLQRLSAVSYWLHHFAEERERIELQEKLPDSALDLSAAQVGFLRLLAHKIPEKAGKDSELQKLVFDTARATPLPPDLAFQAIYVTLLGRTSGPRAGALLSWIDHDFLRRRFTELKFSLSQFWLETSISTDACQRWLDSQSDEKPMLSLATCWKKNKREELSVIDLIFINRNGRFYLKRINPKAGNVGKSFLSEEQVVSVARSLIKDLPAIPGTSPGNNVKLYYVERNSLQLFLYRNQKRL